jgi:adenylate cyclase
MIYEHIPHERRRRLHRAVGEALESLSGERAPEIAAELSVHFERGGDLARAVKYLSRCVARARERFAPREALSVATQALRLLERLPEAPARDKQELELRLLLGVPLSVTRGYTSSEVRDNYARARTLCEKVADPRQLFEIVHAAWYRQLAGAEADGARQSVEELARIAAGLEAQHRWRAALARGRTEMWRGQFGIAVPILLSCIDEAEELQLEVSAQIYGVDPVVAAFSHCALALWFFGHPDQARAYARSGLERAERGGQPFDRASALCQSARVELFCGSGSAATTFAARAAAICADHDLAYFLPVSQFLVGVAAIDQGDVEGGLAQMLTGLAGHRETTGAFLADFSLAWIATAYGRLGQWDEGIQRADEGIELAAHTLERLYVAELWRVKGELLAGRAQASRRRKGPAADRDADAAVACVRRALEIAGQQRAKSLELRSAMSLLRLSMRRDSEREARDLLRSIRAAFTEGFDTRDLTEAHALLTDSAISSGSTTAPDPKPDRGRVRPPG